MRERLDDDIEEQTRIAATARASIKGSEVVIKDVGVSHEIRLLF